MGRYLPDVLEAIISLIPPEEDGLRARLNAIKTGAMYGAPEIQGEFWRRAGNVLGEFFEEERGKPPLVLTGWELDVCEIFSGKKEIKWVRDEDAVFNKDTRTPRNPGN